MWPIGKYERLVSEIKHRENKEIPITFGILIADYRQQKSREYILNYIDIYDMKSYKYINFYLPGYSTEDFSKKEFIKIKEKEYYFNFDWYLDFLRNLEIDFHISFPYKPMLILLEYDKGNFMNTDRIIIELDSNENDIEKVGELFEKIFEISKEFVSIKEISKKLCGQEFKNGIWDDVIKGIDNPILKAVYEKGKNVLKYKIR